MVQTLQSLGSSWESGVPFDSMSCALGCVCDDSVSSVILYIYIGLHLGNFYLFCCVSGSQIVSGFLSEGIDISVDVY